MNSKRNAIVSTMAWLIVAGVLGADLVKTADLHQENVGLQRQIEVNRKETLRNRVVGRDNNAKLAQILASISPHAAYRQSVDRLLAEHYQESAAISRQLAALSTAVAQARK